MPWDSTKSTGTKLTAAEWNAMVIDQKTRIKDDANIDGGTYT